MKTEATPAVETKAAPKSAKKAAPKAAKAAKKAPKAANKAPAAKAVKDAPKTSADKGVLWSEKRVTIVKAMRKLGATSAATAKSAAAIAEKAGCKVSDVKHYCYYKQQLVQYGFVKIATAESENQRGLAYYLTAAGVKANI